MAISITRSALSLLLLPSLIGSSGAALAGPTPGPVAVVRANFDAFHRRDMAAFHAMLAPELSIIDDVPPYEWHGAGAVEAWESDLKKNAKAIGQTDGNVQILSLVRSEETGNRAYVVIKADFTFRLHGQRMSELAEAAETLHKTGDGWKITGWGWSGGVPHVAGKSHPPAAQPHR